MEYGARALCCLCRSTGNAAASSITVLPEEGPLVLGASFADESLTLGLGEALPSAPAASASSCGAGGPGFGGGDGGIEEDVLGSAQPFTSAEDKSGSDAASGRAVGSEGFGCGGGDMEADDEEELGFRGGGGGMEGFMAAAEAEGGRQMGTRRRLGEVGDELRGRVEQAIFAVGFQCSDKNSN